MGVLKRGFKNAFRNVIRSVSIVTILGISIGLALTMLIARQAVQQRIDTVKASTGNTISVSPAGMRGMEGSGSLLTVAQLSEISSIKNVSKVIETLSDRLTKDTNTSLIPSQEMGNFAKRQQNIENGSAPEGSGTTNTSTSTTTGIKPVMPITLTGTNSLDITALSVSKLSFTSGAAFDPLKKENVAIVGKALATKNSLSVGSTFTAYSTTIKVVGIYDTGNAFTNNGLIMQLATTQALTSQAGEVSSATVLVNSMDNLSTVKTAISAKLGDKADVTTSEETAKTIISQFDSIKNITLISLIGALVAGAVIILLTMMMIARERRREIGVLKAIGATDARVVSQFAVESMTLTALGSIVGIIIGVLASNKVTSLLTTTSSSTGGQGGGRGFGGAMASMAGQGMDTVRNIQATVGWDIILYGVGLAFLIAIIGSAIPAWFITKIRPAEVMRAE